MSELIEYRGMKVAAGWPERLAAAQGETQYEIAGGIYNRVPYGSEKHDWQADQKPCHDCAAFAGQLHVPGCDVEECPRCGDQSISCDCDPDEEEEGAA